MTSRSKSRRNKQILKSVFLTSAASALFSLATASWVVYEHFDSRRAHVSDAIWAKREATYEKLLEISSEAASKVQIPEEYERLRDKYYEVSGQMELYSSHHVVSCSTKLRDSLIACANPGGKNREVCSLEGLRHLQFRLSAEMRESLANTTDQTPAHYQQDRLGTTNCDVI
jgi:hypothetical protein